MTLKPDTVVHVWKWWPVATAGASGGASGGASAQEVRGHAAHAVHALPPDATTGHTVPADSSLRSEPHLDPNCSQGSHEDLTQQQSRQQSSQQSNQQFSQQQSSQQVSQRGSSGPMGCQLSRGCPGEIGSWGAGEEPGWFPEMEKVTAQVCALLSASVSPELSRADDAWSI